MPSYDRCSCAGSVRKKVGASLMVRFISAFLLYVAQVTIQTVQTVHHYIVERRRPSSSDVRARVAKYDQMSALLVCRRNQHSSFLLLVLRSSLVIAL